MVTTPRQSQPRVHFIEIEADSAGQRLDNFLLCHLKGVPRSRVYRLVRQGEVRINKGRSKPGYRLQSGDVIRIPPVRTALPARSRTPSASLQWLNQCILFEDDQLLAINKPSGLAVHGGSGVSLGLIEALRQLRKQDRYLELVHRLDRDTSGLLLVAKKRSTLRELHRQLRQGRIRKIYSALLKGKPKTSAWRVDMALTKNQLRSGERVVLVDEEGKPSQSRFSVQHYYPETTASRSACLVEIELITGRTHQARVHAAYTGHPIAGDDKYGDRDFNANMATVGLSRLFLHATRLELVHPAKAFKLRLEAPLPEELVRVLKHLANE